MLSDLVLSDGRIRLRAPFGRVFRILIKYREAGERAWRRGERAHKGQLSLKRKTSAACHWSNR
jgi:hypothetical protein